MSFDKKTWTNRESQYPARRRLIRPDTGTETVYDIERDEGTVTEQGDDFSAENMNDLEDRIEDALSSQVLLTLLNPVGTVIYSTTCDTMAKVVQAYGGTTWIQHEGYVLRGATSNVTAGTQGQTNDGGADSVSVSSVASHNHTQDSHNHTQDSHNHTQNSHNHYTTTYDNGQGNFTTGPYSTTRAMSVNRDSSWTTATNQAKTATNQAKTATNQAKGATYSLTTLPKYKNIYIWERIA